jgi:RNA recognition motif-containing protein
MNPGAIMPGEQRRSAGRSEVFVGNLDFTATEDELRNLFVSAGFTVEKVGIVRDRSTGQPRGFAFVAVEGFKEAAAAVTKLDGTELAGRRLRLNVAEEKSRP